MTQSPPEGQFTQGFEERANSGITNPHTPQFSIAAWLDPAVDVFKGRLVSVHAVLRVASGPRNEVRCDSDNHCAVARAPTTPGSSAKVEQVFLIVRLVSPAPGRWWGAAG